MRLTEALWLARTSFVWISSAGMASTFAVGSSINTSCVRYVSVPVPCFPISIIPSCVAFPCSSPALPKHTRRSFLQTDNGDVGIRLDKNFQVQPSTVHFQKDRGTRVGCRSDHQMKIFFDLFAHKDSRSGNRKDGDCPAFDNGQQSSGKGSFACGDVSSLQHNIVIIQHSPPSLIR